MIRTFIQVFGLILILISSIFLIKGVLGLRDNDIATLSQTMWDHNKEAAENLCHQRADTVIGVVLLLTGFLLQLFNLCWEMRIGDFAVNRIGVILAIISSVIVWFLAIVASDLLYKKQYKRVEGILSVKRSITDKMQP